MNAMHWAKLTAIGALGILVSDFVRQQSFITSMKSPNTKKFAGLAAGGLAAALVNHFVMHKAA